MGQETYSSHISHVIFRQTCADRTARRQPGSHSHDLHIPVIQKGEIIRNVLKTLEQEREREKGT